MCDQLLTPPNKPQTLRHALYGNEIFLCKTPYGESQGLLGIIHHDVAELQEKLEKQELETDLIESEDDLEEKSTSAKVRVLIVQEIGNSTSRKRNLKSKVKVETRNQNSKTKLEIEARSRYSKLEIETRSRNS